MKEKQRLSQTNKSRDSSHHYTCLERNVKGFTAELLVRLPSGMRHLTDYTVGATLSTLRVVHQERRQDGEVEDLELTSSHENTKIKTNC